MQLSDQGGGFEVSVFDEGLLNDKRDLFEVGSLVYIDGQGKMGDNGPRFIVKKIKPLDEYLQGRKPKNITLNIVVDNDSAMAAISEVLGNPAGSGCPVTLEIPTDGSGRASVKLPGKYQVTPHVVDRLKTVSGVLSADEVA